MKYIVRMWDRFDGWIDITGPLSEEDAQARWSEETQKGTRNTKYGDGHYFEVFPANTRMVMTPEYFGK